MNLRCSFCQTPFTIGRIEKLDALQHMEANKLTHYDAHCPRCRRSTPVLRQKLEMTMPNWRAELEKLEAEMAAHPQREAPLPAPESLDQTQGKPASTPQVESKPEPVPAPVKEKPAPKPKAEAKEKPAEKAKTSTAKAKTETKKPAAKTSTEKAKPATKKAPAKKSK